MAVLTAIGLAACAGLWAFLPIFGVGLAARLPGWPLPPGLETLASDTALLIFGLARRVELAADKIPVVDSILEVIHAVVGPVVGVLAAYISFSNLPLPYALALAIMTGAAVAGGVHALAATSRIKTSVLTVGIANPVLSVIEDILAISTLVLTILAPVLVLLVFAVVIFLILRRRRTRALA